MGSSAQNSSGVHWCRPRVSFNRVPEKVPERFRRRSGKLGSTGSGEGSRRRFNRAPEKIPEKVWEALVQGQVKFNRVPEKVPEKVWKALTGSGESSGEGLGGGSEECLEKVPQGGFGAEPGWVQQGSGEGLGAGSEECPEKVSEKVPGGFGAEPGHVQQGSGEGSGEGLGGFGAEAGQVQQGSGEGSGEGSRKPWCKAKSSSTEKVAEAKRGQVRFT